MTRLTVSQIQKGLLPAGLSDILHPQAKDQAKTIENLLDVFSNYGYFRVKPPLVEYEETAKNQLHFVTNLSIGDYPKMVIFSKPKIVIN